MSYYCMEHFVVMREIPTGGTWTAYEMRPDHNGVLQSVPVQKPTMMWTNVVTHCNLLKHDDTTPHNDGLNNDPNWTKPVVPKFEQVAEADAWLDRRAQ